MAAIMAVPNPSMMKALPNSISVIVKVIALMTNRNKPSDKTVIGSVKTTKIGLTMTFKMDNIKLANSAVPNPSI